MRWIIAGFLLWVMLVIVVLWFKQRETLKQFRLFGIRALGVIVAHTPFPNYRPIVRFQTLDGVVIEAEGKVLYQRLKKGLLLFGKGQQIKVIYDQRNPWVFCIDNSSRD